MKKITNILFLFIVGITCAQQINVDSIVAVARDPNLPDSLRFASYRYLYRNLIYVDEEQTLGLVQEAATLAEHSASEIWKADANYMLGFTYFFNGLYYDALKAFDQAKNGYLTLEEYIEYANAEGGMANIYNEFEMYADALSMYRSADSVLNEYANEEISHKAVVWANMSNAYSNLEEYKRSLNYAKKAAKVFTDLQREDNLAITHLLIADNYASVKKLDSALHYIALAESFYQGQNLSYGVMQTLLIKARCYYDRKELSTSLAQLKTALSLADTVNPGSEVMEMYRMMSENYEAMQNPEKALQSFKKYIDMKEKVIFEKKREEVVNYVNRSEIERKKLELQSLKEKKELAESREQQLSKEKWITNLVLAFVFLALLSLFLYYRKVMKVNKVIHQKNAIIASNYSKIKAVNNELAQTNENLNGVVEKKEDKIHQLAFYNSHYVRAPLAKILGLILWVKDEQSQENYPMFLDMLHEATLELDQMIRNIGNILSDNVNE